jgi:hypothetical protein
MHRQSRLGTGACLDVRRYTTFDARTYAPHQHGARLGVVDLVGYSKIPRSARQFRAEIRHRPIPQSPDNPASPVRRHSFALGVLEYTLQTSRKTGEGIKYNTARSLQSTASAYQLWEKMLQFPGHVYRDRYNNFIGDSHVSPTDSVIATLGNKGMMRCMGTESRPPADLRYRHFAFNQEFRGRQYNGCGNYWLIKYEYAAANFAETCA